MGGHCFSRLGCFVCCRVLMVRWNQSTRRSAVQRITQTVLPIVGQSSSHRQSTKKSSNCPPQNHSFPIGPSHLFGCLLGSLTHWWAAAAAAFTPTDTICTQRQGVQYAWAMHRGCDPAGPRTPTTPHSPQGGLWPTVCCQRYRHKESMGAEGAQLSTSTRTTTLSA